MRRTVQAEALRYLDKVVLSFPFDAELIEAIKYEFAIASRSYDPDARTWTIKAPHVDKAIALLRRYFPDAAVRTFGKQEQHTPPPHQRPSAAPPSPYATLHLLPTAPPEVVRAVYNALVKKHHPDVVAPEQKLIAHQTMTRLNAAIGELRERGAA